MANSTRGSLNKSPRYRAFITQRDYALEALHLKCQQRITDTLAGALQRTLETISFWYGHGQGSIYALRDIENKVDQPFKDAMPVIIKAIEDMRRRVYLLAHAGEAEAIGRAIGKPQKVSLHGHGLYLKSKGPSPAGGELHHRVALYLDRIKTKIIDALKVAAINDDTLPDAIDKVRRSFPRVKYYKRPKKILKLVREADMKLGKDITMTVGFIDDNEWNDMIDDYSKDYVFTNRGPDGQIPEAKSDQDIIGFNDTYPQYEWEVEKDVTQDFVQQVRDGQIDAANENGITDFVWIAILDERTDFCCEWRNGLTTKEISDALENEHADDECDAITPSAHFGCRCSIAPITDDMPETTPPNIGEFEDWLNQTSS